MALSIELFGSTLSQANVISFCDSSSTYLYVYMNHWDPSTEEVTELQQEFSANRKKEQPGT